jgi:hypothetical protein
MADNSLLGKAQSALIEFNKFWVYQVAGHWVIRFVRVGWRGYMVPREIVRKVEKQPFWKGDFAIALNKTKWPSPFAAPNKYFQEINPYVQSTWPYHPRFQNRMAKEWYGEQAATKLYEVIPLSELETSLIHHQSNKYQNMHFNADTRSLKLPTVRTWASGVRACVQIDGPCSACESSGRVSLFTGFELTPLANFNATFDCISSLDLEDHWQ